MKNSKGITLIALVITIILLILLVAVTVTLAINSGLFNYAGHAAKRSEQEKQAEQDWADLSGNLGEDQLIAKYTTNKKEDLSKLKQYFEEKSNAEVYDGKHFDNNEIIPDASDSIQVLNDNYEESLLIVKYHNNVYKISYVEENKQRIFTTVEECTELETITLGGKCLLDTTNVAFYNYENDLYKVTSENQISLLGDNDVVVIDVNNYIQFSAKQGQTWIQWKEDSDYSSIDLTLQNRFNIKTVNR